MPALGFAPAALAQSAGDQAAEQTSEADGEAEKIITVTGSRIARDGYDAPTPVNVVTEAELDAEPQANIGDYVSTLPAVRGSQSSSTNSGSLSNGQAGIATVNLRNLGANRTLILIDGQRSVASATVGFVDVQTIPQGLIKGVEVVTGGASSAYGSDAVAGVVNFILDKDFTGLKAEYEYGITTYGDVPNHLVRLTGGTNFADGRGKLLLAGDYFTQEGVDTIDRKWQQSGFFQIDTDKLKRSARALVGKVDVLGALEKLGFPDDPAGIKAHAFDLAEDQWESNEHRALGGVVGFAASFMV